METRTLQSCNKLHEEVDVHRVRRAAKVRHGCKHTLCLFLVVRNTERLYHVLEQARIRVPALL